MARYLVKFVMTRFYDVEVEADDEDGAWEKASEVLEFTPEDGPHFDAKAGTFIEAYEGGPHILLLSERVSS